jgi:flagellar hook-associated protein 3 FlgL
MLRALDPSVEKFLSDVLQVQRRLDRAQRQISSGKRILTASDDPDQVSTMLQVRVDLEQARQIKVNLGRVKTEVDTGEQALQQSLTLMDRVKALASQGASGTQTASTRASIAGELEAILQQLVNISRTQVDGRYIFSGDSDQVAPYTIDLTQPNGVSLYQGSAATRQTRHPSGTLFSIGRTAQEIFDSATPEKNAFAAVNAMRLALLNNDETTMATALGDLNSAHAHINDQLAFFGTAQNKVEEASDYASNLQVRLKEELSGIEDADIAAAILELEQAKVSQEAAFTTHSQLPRTSLFDYLR